MKSRSPHLTEAHKCFKHPKEWQRPRKHHPHVARQNNELPLRNYLHQPSKQKRNLTHRISLSNPKKLPQILWCAFSQIICFDNLVPMSKRLLQSEFYVPFFFKKRYRKVGTGSQLKEKYQELTVTWLHIAVLKRGTSRRSSILITSWRICISW